MKDSTIIQKLEARDESALQDISAEYGNLGRQIAMRILDNPQDAEECINDALLRIWNSIPPAKPKYLKAYFSAAVRNTSLNRYSYDHADKRCASEVCFVLDELAEVLADRQNVEAETEASMLDEAVRRFLKKQSSLNQKIFLQRYYYMMTCPEIAAGLGISENRVNVALYRMRQKLGDYLRKEQYI